MDIQTLCGILRCPRTGARLRPDGDQLVSELGAAYPLVGGVPVFTPDGDRVQVQAEQHLSNRLAPAAAAVAAQADGPVLNLSAGGSKTKPPNVVELEYSIFRNTDVVGDAHQLPFAADTFAACICMNAFEHYRDPRAVAAEVLRVLRPGGTFFMHTAGLQPLHEPPHHYFNATCFGVAEWLGAFEQLEIGVSANFNPVFGLSWVVSEIEAGVKAHQGEDLARQLASATLGEVLEFWRTPSSRSGPLWKIFKDLDATTQRVCAAGWQARGVKPAAP